MFLHCKDLNINIQIIMDQEGISVISENPFIQFTQWYRIIRESGREDYNAAALSTCGMKGRVSSRMVLLKKFDTSGFVFFTNYESRKGLDIYRNPFAALLFYWPEQGRQLRIEGQVLKVSRKESDEYFHSRIPGHKINAIASPQSTEIPGRAFLRERYKELAARYSVNEPERPGYWGGYRLEPDLFEFWQEGSNRLHDRLEYSLQDSKWKIRRLAP